MKYLKLFVPCIILLCCHNKREKPLPVAFNKDIPVDAKGRQTNLYKNIRFGERKYKLDTIENGFDSMQIRIWLGYSLIDTMQVIVLRNTDNSWKGLFYTIVPHYTNTGDSPVSVDIFKKEVFPKNNWDLVLDSLFKNDILTLPSDSKLPGYEWVWDGNVMAVEISTLSEYRLYSYSTMTSEVKPPQILKIENIMKIITNEFDIEPLHRFP